MLEPATPPKLNGNDHADTEWMLKLLLINSMILSKPHFMRQCIIC